MARNLIIDIGNTRSKLAVFSDRKLVKLQILKRDLIDTDISSIAVEEAVSGIFISSTGQDVKPLLDTVSGIPSMQMSTSLQFPIRLTYHTPFTLGHDRIAVMVAATQFAYNNNKVTNRYLPDYVLVVDVGTAITYDIAHRAGIHLGGMISPGFWMRLRALNEYTDRLPEGELRYGAKFLGDSTPSSIQSGAMNGGLIEIRGMIDEIEQQYGSVLVMMTGGDAVRCANYLDRKIFIEQNLVLFGLNEIYRFNA